MKEEERGYLSMKRLTVLLDYDGVLFDTMPHWVDALNDTYNLHIAYSDITEWDLTKTLPLTKEEIFAPLNYCEFWYTLQPAFDGPDIVRSLLANGHVVKLATSTYYRHIVPKKNRLFECYPLLKWEDVIITSSKYLLKGDVLIDDAIHNLIGGDYYKILMNQSHNETFNTEGMKVKRVNNLTEAYEVIKCLTI